MVSFKALVVFAVLLLAVAGPTLARVYVLDDGVDDATDKPETTTTTTTTTTTSTTTQLPTTLLPETTADDSPESNTTESSSKEGEAQDRVDIGDPPDDPIERSDQIHDHSWTPVALVKGTSSKTPFEVFKHVESNEKAPKRTGFRNVRTQRGSLRYSSSDSTQRPPPPTPPRLISMTFPERDMSSYMIHNQSPGDSIAMGSENVGVTIPPPQVREDPEEDPYQEAIGGVPPALAAVTAAGVPGLVEDALIDQEASQANLGPRNQQSVFRPSEEWRNNYQYQQHQHSNRQNHDKVISANGEVIQLIPFTLEDTVPRTTPTYFPHPNFNEQLNSKEKNQNKDNQNENVFMNFRNTVPVPTPPTIELPRNKPRPFPTATVKPRPFPSSPGKAHRNTTSTRNPSQKEEKRNRRPSFVTKFNPDLSQDTGITTTRAPKPDFSNHPNGAFSRQVFNFGNQTVVEVVPTSQGGKKEVSFPLNATSQDRFNSSRKLRPQPTQSTSLGHRPIYGGFDRYRVPGGRPKVGYNVRTRPSGGNSLHPHHLPHHHPHDSHGSSSINVGRVVLPPNTVIQTKPKPPPGYVHRHPSYVSLQGAPHVNPTPGAPPPSGFPGNASGGPPLIRFSHQQTSFPKTDYRPGGLSHPAVISDHKRPHSAHDHYPVVTIQKYRYPPPPPPPGYGKGRPPGPRPQVHPSEEGVHRKPFYGNDDLRGPPQGGPVRHPIGQVGQGPVRQGGPSGLGGPVNSPGIGGPGGLGGPGGNKVHAGPTGLAGLNGVAGQPGLGQSNVGAHGGQPGGGPGNTAAGQNIQNYGDSIDGTQVPSSTPLRSQYPEYPQGTRDEPYASATINQEHYVPNPSAPYKENGRDENARYPYNPNAPNPTVQTYPFPTHSTVQNKYKSYPSDKPSVRPGGPNDNRDEYEDEDYYSPHNHRIRPTTIRPTGYKNPHKGFSVKEITQTSQGNPPPGARRPDDKPKHYGFPKLPSSTMRPPPEDSLGATSSQTVNIGGNSYKERNPGYSVYEEENYPSMPPTPRPRPTKYTPASSSTQPHRGKTAYVSSSTNRPRYKTRRPVFKTTTDTQVAAGSLSASYTSPPMLSGDAGKKGGDEMTLTYAKTDYNGNVKWGVRHQVGTSSGGGGVGGGGDYGH